MKKITIFTSTALLLASLITTGYIVFKAQLRTNLALNTKVAIISEKIEKIQFNISDIYNNFMQKYKKMRRSILGEITKNPWYSPEKPVQQIVIHLKHGGMIAGKLLKKSRDKYIVEWKGEKIAIDAARVKRIERKTQKAVEWPYKNDVVVKRTNGIILDAKIVDVKKDSVTLLYLEGGGSLELDVNRSDIECLLFAPVYTRESQELETQLKRQFPKMEFYTEGNFTIITDSYSRTVSSYKRAIKNVYTNIYLKFFKLFNGRKPKRQNFVVVFDDFVDFAEYAITDGVPFWAVLGYFSPTDNVLYLFNAFGKRIEKMVFDVIVGKTGKTVDEIADEIKKRVDERYHMTIEGRVETVKDKYQAAY
ncbi:MAG: hypothetical protein ISS92_01210, partial [Candidatus Omnitrophica bacterium]|nr:hypothetical protein [Candidatus Omnitrophota bacterium]